MILSRIFSRWSVRVSGGQNSGRVYVSPRGNIAAFTHQAQRESNEDGFFVRYFPGVVLAVGDGVASDSDGEVASQIAIRTLQKRTRIKHPLQPVFLRANDRILKAAARKGKGTLMSTTFTAVRVAGDRAEIASCGDSRIFLFRKKRETLLLTQDHNDAFDRYQTRHKVSFPLSNPEEYYEFSRTLKGENILWSGLGIKDPEIFSLEGNNAVPLQIGDRILLCTDGLHRYLPYGVLSAVMISGMQPEDIVRELFERTMVAIRARGSTGDNITIVLYQHLVSPQ